LRKTTPSEALKKQFVSQSLGASPGLVYTGVNLWSSLTYDSH